MALEQPILTHAHTKCPPVPRNTLRDYIGICELQIIDGGGYKRVVEAERQKMGKISAKSIELRCRAVLN